MNATIEIALLEKGAELVAATLPEPFGAIVPALIAATVDAAKQLAAGAPPEAIRLAPLPDLGPVVAELLAGDQPGGTP